LPRRQLVSAACRELPVAHKNVFDLIQFSGPSVGEIGGIAPGMVSVERLHLISPEWAGTTPAKDHRLIPGLVHHAVAIQSA
jgi:hypothetical protein